MGSKRDTLTITDNRTGKIYEVPVHHGTYAASGGGIRAEDLRQIRVSDDDLGMVSYDPGLRNTAICRSGITFVDGKNGVLQYRGYPIEQLAEHSTFLEVVYLLVYGELPTQQLFDIWRRDIVRSGMLHESVKAFMEGFHYDAHSMGVLVGALGALSTFYPDAREIRCQRYYPGGPEVCDIQSMDVHVRRLLGSIATIAAFGYRHSRGLPYIYPDEDLGYIANLLNMLFGIPEVVSTPTPVLERALDVLFMLHADHEQNCSTTTMRCIGSTQADPYSAAAGAAAALYGPLHGGADEAVLQMLAEIETKDSVPAYLARVKGGEAPLPGFGHRLYKKRDPRVAIIKKTAEEVFGVRGRNPLMDVALEMERIASGDEYFVSRGLFPNTEFYSGIVYQAMGLPLDMMSVLFAIPRTAGWLANWKEMLLDEGQTIIRPRQIYTGVEQRDYVPMEERR